MKRYPIDKNEFAERHHSAVMYHRRARQFLDEGQSLNVVFDVASVAIENYLIAVCDFYGADPGTHNYQSLMETVEMLAELEVPKAVSNQIEALDAAFGICSLENYQRKTDFSREEILKVFGLCQYFADLLEKKIA
ncbi:hypothetical protein [Pectinatus haikarae]|uniref:HEPN domain-containing protein n=1 Tax=Pectinatus haikarae TaxID=349096 RepID=A0ABT9Y7E2_9FIRM|nr:hypothetical protein [Pectinatus haikarae]MDQ0203142.1 hypothetical protein [Pectinatus haikarae]